MKNIIKWITVLKVCFVITFFASIAFATSPGPGGGVTSGGSGSGPQAQIIKQCGTEINAQYIYYLLAAGGLIAVLIYVLTGKKPLEFEDDSSLPPVPPREPLYKSNPHDYAYSNPTPSAKVQEPSGASKSIPLQTGSNSIGRDPSNKISLDDPKASRKHADLHVSPEGKYTLTDLGSQNGTMVNGERISQQEICSGDRIGIGDSTITV